MPELTKSQVNRLGERLRQRPAIQEDLQLLDEYRRSFAPAYDDITQILKSRSLEFQGRQAKTTQSIVAKLKRETLKLGQMQDVAGCRIIVASRIEQNVTIELLKARLFIRSIKDRREQPSHGYRAVHLIAEALGKRVEIQVRTQLQHLWAGLSEKAFDVVDPAIKYGGGPEYFKKLLDMWSLKVADYETAELRFHEEEKSRRSLPGLIASSLDETERQDLKQRNQQISLSLQAIMNAFDVQDSLKLKDDDK